MPGELVILNEQLQILFPICDEIGIIIQQITKTFIKNA